MEHNSFMKMELVPIGLDFKMRTILYCLTILTQFQAAVQAWMKEDGIHTSSGQIINLNQ